MSYETILIEKTDGVGIITLNRPEVVNAMNMKLSQEMDQAITQMEQDDEVGAVIVTGAGDRAFSAGADIHENRLFTPQERERNMDIRSEYAWHLATCRKPTIGAINGLCYGGGTVLATSLDFLIGCERTRFRFLAVVYGQLNATWTMANMIGWPMTKEILFSGREVLAEEAYHIGLINHLIPSEQVMDKALEIARTIAGNHHRSVQGVKELLIGNVGKSWKEMWQAEIDARRTKYKGVPIEEGFKDFIARKGRDPAR